MREGSSYRCHDCGWSSPIGTRCPECDGPMLDEHGNPPLRPLARRSIGAKRAAGGGVAAIGAGLLLSAWGLPALTAAASLIITGSVVAVGSMAGPFVQRRRRIAEARRRARRTLAAAAAVESVPELRARAVVRVRGRVRALERAPRGVVVATDRGIERASGRFAVEGDHGIAVVDDDCFEVWRRRGDDPVAESGGTVADGMTIDVVGPASAAPIADAVLQEGVPGGRDGALVLCFDGSPEVPVLLILSD